MLHQNKPNVDIVSFCVTKIGFSENFVRYLFCIFEIDLFCYFFREIGDNVRRDAVFHGFDCEVCRLPACDP